MLQHQKQEAVVCENLAKCPIFAKFSSASSKEIWIMNYCKGMKKDKCARKLLKDQGKPVPSTLLPNGKHLKSL